jgi:hypothetical protein
MVGDLSEGRAPRSLAAIVFTAARGSGPKGMEARGGVLVLRPEPAPARRISAKKRCALARVVTTKNMFARRARRDQKGSARGVEVESACAPVRSTVSRVGGFTAIRYVHTGVRRVTLDQRDARPPH